jgi:hypothetical protein
MFGQRPVPSKAARKSVTPVYTFHAHKVVLSAGSRVFANYFYTHPKVRLRLKRFVSRPGAARVACAFAELA